MTWKWESMTAPVFQSAVTKAKGVCIVPLGVIEKHGDHLPLGTDVFDIQAIAERAAEQEAAIVFPFYYFGQIHEAKHCPGTIAIRTPLIFELLDNLCEEISRNGLKKIILLNGHGGNEFVLPAFVMSRLEKPRDYVVYGVRLGDFWHEALNDPEWKRRRASEFDYHGGEAETSVALSVCPDLVRMADVPAQPAVARKRLAHLPRLFTAIGWYADFDAHYAGDAREANAEKGELLLDRMVGKVVDIIKQIKLDDRTGELEKEFYSGIQH